MAMPDTRHFCPGCMSETKAAPCPNCGFDERIYRPAPQHLPPQTLLNGKYVVGRVLREAVAYRDFPMIQGVFLISSLLVLLCLFLADRINGDSAGGAGG